MKSFSPILFTRGKKLSEEHKQNISKNAKDQWGAKNAMARVCITPIGTFETIAKAGEAHSISRGAAYRRLAQNYEGWNYG